MILPEFGGPFGTIEMTNDGTIYSAAFDEFEAIGTSECNYFWTYQAYVNDLEIFTTLNDEMILVTYDANGRNLTFSTFVQDKIHKVKIIGTLSDTDST